jgi:hypothetical protein
MNERIKELAKQAHEDVIRNTPSFLVTRELYEQKFAELIVTECVGVVEGGSFLHGQAPTALFAKECSGAIKRHFGVEK